MVQWRRRSGEVEERVAVVRSGGAGGRKVEGAERFVERRWRGKESVEERFKRAKRQRKAREDGKERKEGEKRVPARHGRCAQV